MCGTGCATLGETDDMRGLDKQTDRVLAVKWISENRQLFIPFVSRGSGVQMSRRILLQYREQSRPRRLEVKIRGATNSCWGHRGSKVELISRNTLDALVPTSGYDPGGILGFCRQQSVQCLFVVL
ncbi:hypothetical protein BS47DRAFT_1025595 [Hydnum rufescens UP504]|uniref:Uncharacterized protein n=1 Tax=Hydnum rufescens UP504 TaxID=1448309 RepID=A0A9P6AVZ0_9AGAM|nr:hypothetical protein BS47DRAFT_1025595 [Hydnum rufescens UP504]